MKMRPAKLSVLVLVCLAAAIGVFLVQQDSAPPPDSGAPAAPEWNEHDPADPLSGGLIAERESSSSGGRVALTDEEMRAELTAAQPAHLAVHGRVVDAAGAPVAGATVAPRVRRSFDPGRFGGGRGGRGPAGFRELLRMKPLGEPVQTRPDGTFKLHGEAFQETVLEIVVRHDQYAPKTARREWNVADGVLALGDIAISRGGTLTGQVVDESGVPLADAAVRLAAAGGRGPGGPGGPFGGGGDADDLPGARTARDGSFAIARVPAGDFVAEAKASGYPIGFSRRVEIKEGEASDAGTIQLERGVALSGLVTDPNGRPIAGARVEADVSRLALFEGIREELAPGGNADRGGRGGRGFDFGAMRGMMFGASAIETQTDARGEFRFDAVPRAGIALTVTHPQYIDERRDPLLPAQTPRVQVQMTQRIVVEGVVLDERTGRPVEMYGIAARRIRGGGDGGFDFGRRGGRGERGERRDQGPENAGGETDPQAAARAREREARIAQFEAERRQEEASRQRYLGPSGEVPGDTPPPSQHAEGRFSVDGLQDGEYVFDIDAPGYVKIAAGPVTLERGQDKARATFRIARGQGAEGRVFAQHGGEPIAGARVELLLPSSGNGERSERRGGRGGGPGFGGPGGFFGGPGGTVVERAITDAAGQFALRSVLPGTYVLRVNARDFLPWSNTNVALGREAARLDVAMLAGARVSGTVIGLAANETARVVFLHAEGERRTADATAGGAYEIKGLPAGNWFVRVERMDEDGWRRRISMTIAARDGAQPDLVLTPGADVRYDPVADREDLGGIEGTVRLNRALAELEVRLQPIDDQPRSEPDARDGDRGGDFRGGRRGGFGRFLRSDVDDKGSYSIESVPPGRYFLEVSRRGRGGSALHRTEVRIAAGEPQHRNVDVLVGGLRITCADAENKPVARARASLVLAADAAGKTSEQWRELPSFRALPVRGGIIESEDLEVGTWLIEVTAAGLTPGRTEAQIGPGAVVELQLKLEAPKKP